MPLRSNTTKMDSSGTYIRMYTFCVTDYFLDVTVVKLATKRAYISK